MIKKESFLLKLSLLGITLVLVPAQAIAAHKFYPGYNVECYVDDEGQDRFWFCGNQSPWCHGNKASKKDTKTFLMHGKSFNWTKHGGQGNYWCCNGSVSEIGAFVQAEAWIDESKTIVHTENVPGGTCKWREKFNVCGIKDAVASEIPCTIADPANGCADGYVVRNGKCVQECKEGYVFASETSNNCIECKTTTQQAIVHGACKKCELNEILDKKTLECMTIQEVATRKLQISALAHEECWLCVNPSALDKCLRWVTETGQKISENPELSAKCSLNSKEDKPSESK